MTAGLRWRALGAAALCALGVAMLGGLATELGPWYVAQKRPAFQPPDWLFGPAWTLIYACAAMSAANAWLALAGQPSRRQTLLLLWAANAFFNVLWSLLYFRLRRPDWALAEVVVLWLSIAVLLVFTRRVSAPAARWLWPYLAWVSFAAALNAEAVRLNAPY